MHQAHERDLKAYKKLLTEDTKKPNESSRGLADRKEDSGRRNHCIACRDMWKRPLPPPKKIYIDPPSIKGFVSKSTYLMTLLIKEEAERMEQRDRIRKEELMEINRKEAVRRDRNKERFRTSDSSTDKRTSFYVRKGRKYGNSSSTTNSANDAVSQILLDNIKVAKIKNQISTKENSKKVKKFLEEPL